MKRFKLLHWFHWLVLQVPKPEGLYNSLGMIHSRRQSGGLKKNLRRRRPRRTERKRNISVGTVLFRHTGVASRQEGTLIFRVDPSEAETFLPCISSMRRCTFSPGTLDRWQIWFPMCFFRLNFPPSITSLGRNVSFVAHSLPIENG